MMTETSPDGPRLSLVVNYFNPRHLTRVQAITTLCLEALRDNTRCSLEVILSDGSGLEDPKIRAVCERLDCVYTVSPTPKNIEAIYNHGLSLARGEYVGILENDIFVVQNWDEKCFAEFARTGAAMAVPYMSSCDTHIQQTGFVARHVTFEPSNISHNLVVMDRRAFAAIYPLDTRLHATWNDTDMYLRAKAAGLRMIVVNCEGIVHYRGSSAAYNPLNPMEEDNNVLLDKYPKLKRWRVNYTPCSFADPLIARSRCYRWLLKLCTWVPGQRLANYLVKHCTRLEPLFHRI